MARMWAQLPMGRVVRLGGASSKDVMLALEPLPDDAPAIVTYSPPSASSVSELVTALLAELERAAIELFPSWLPDAEGITGSGGASIPAVRALALRTASASRHFGPFLADLAELSLHGGTRGRSDHRKFPLKCVPRDSPVSSPPASVAIERRSSSAFPGGSPPSVRMCWSPHPNGWPIAAASASGSPARRSSPSTESKRSSSICPLRRTRPARALAYPKDPLAILRFPAVAGMPHPASRAEKSLEAALKSRPWAAGRAWNQTHHYSSPLTPSVRIDLLWHDERCAVEIDGPEHRGEDAYEADRRRDVRLQLDGYAVLRFTNKQIMNEMDLVLKQLERFLESRRSGTFKGSHHA